MADVPLRPQGVKFYGYQLAVRKLTGQPYNTWDDIYINWDFEGYIKPQIDWIKAIGANTLILIGANAWVTAGGMTQSQYIARRRQVVEYCATVGMYFMPYLFSAYHNWGSTTNAQSAALAAADAGMLGAYDNVPCIILMDEPWAQQQFHGATYADVIAGQEILYDAVKAVVPSNLPVAVNCPQNAALDAAAKMSPTYSDGTGSNATRLAGVIDYCDFLNLHAFYSGVAAADWAALHALYPDKDIIITSAGPTQNLSGATQTARVDELMVCANHSESRGIGLWCIRDFDDASGSAGGVSGTNRYGAFDDDGTPRTAITNAFAAGVLETYPARVRRTYAGNPRLNNLTHWQYI